MIDDAKKDIYIGKCDKEKGKQVVAFKSTSKLTKDQAVEAMGDQKDKFVVETFAEGDWPAGSDS